MSLAALVAGSPLVSAQRDPSSRGDQRRVPGFDEMTSNCTAILLTVGAPLAIARRSARADWAAVDALHCAVSVPVPVVVVKGIMTALEATTAVAHGADGVQSVIELLQTELGRVMGCCGAPNLAAITSRVVTVHAPQPPRERV